MQVVAHGSARTGCRLARIPGNKFARVLLAVGVLAVTAVRAEAKTLYVDAARGNDATSHSANGPDAPWRTLGRASWGSPNRNSPNTSEAARAGDTVIVRAGTYTTTGTGDRFNPAFNPVNSGSAGNQLVFQAESGVVLTFSSGIGPVIGVANQSYVTWKGFVVNESLAPSTSDTGPVTLSGTRGSSIEDCTIIGRGNINRMDNYPGIRIEWASDLLIRNNRVSNFLGGTNSPAVQLYRAGRVIFEHNEFFNVGNGIAIKGTAEAEYNDWFIIRNNLMHHIDLAGVWIHRAAAPPYIRIYQNVVRDSAAGVIIHNFGDWTEPQHVQVINNTLHANVANIVIQYDSVAANANHRFQNNLITGGRTAAIHFSDMTPANITTARYLFARNMYQGNANLGYGISDVASLSSWQSQFGQDQGSTNANPLYVNAAAFDFRLQAASPARNAGIDFLDLNRNGSTTDAITIGAYITGSEVIGPTTASATNGLPGSPTNLRIVP